MELHRPISSSRTIDRKFPPPLATAAQFVKRSSTSGRVDRCCPDQVVRGVRLQAVRSNGRFVLQEVKIPSEEVVFVHSIREQGRLVVRMERRKPEREIKAPVVQSPVPAPVPAAAAVASNVEKSAPVVAPRPIAPLPPLPLSTPPTLPLPKSIAAPPPSLAIKSSRAVDPEPVPAVPAPIHPHSSPNSPLESSPPRGEEPIKKKLPQPEAQLLQELIGACGNRMDMHLRYGIAVR